MKKLFKVALVSAIMAGSLGANDFLAKITNGTLSDNQTGVTTLNETAMGKIKGGYEVEAYNLGSFAIAVALPHFTNELGYHPNYDTMMQMDRGLCPMGVTECFYNKETKSHLEQNRNRLRAYVQALTPSYVPAHYALAFTVTKHPIIKKDGSRDVYFSYGVAAVNYQHGTVHPISVPTGTIDNNVILRELRDAYKNTLEWSLKSR